MRQVTFHELQHLKVLLSLRQEGLPQLTVHKEFAQSPPVTNTHLERVVRYFESYGGKDDPSKTISYHMLFQFFHSVQSLWTKQAGESSDTIELILLSVSGWQTQTSKPALHDWFNNTLTLTLSHLG